MKLGNYVLRHDAVRLRNTKLLRPPGTRRSTKLADPGWLRVTYCQEAHIDCLNNNNDGINATVAICKIRLVAAFVVCRTLALIPRLVV